MVVKMDDPEKRLEKAISNLLLFGLLHKPSSIMQMPEPLLGWGVGLRSPWDGLGRSREASRRRWDLSSCLLP